MRKWLCGIAVASLALFAAPDASANGLGASIYTTLSLAGVTVVGGGVALGVVITTASGDGGDAEESKEAFLRRNAVALKRDLTLGDGRSVDTLAAIFRIEERHHRAFGRMLRRHRDELVPLTDVEKLDAERADRFFRIIARGLQRDPMLRKEVRQVGYGPVSGS